jgi:DNA-directed RNA polymerase specialized sigma24 family protein
MGSRQKMGESVELDGRAMTSSEDERVFEALYPGLRRFAAVVAPRGSDPDDLVQEGLMRTLEKTRLSALENPARYLQLVMVRIASNERRRRAREGAALLRLPPDRAAAVLDPDVGTSGLLDDLLPRDRALLYLSIVEGLDANGVAERLEMTAPAVRMAKSRALSRLRATTGGANDV